MGITQLGITQFFRQIPRLLQVLSLLGFLLLLAAIAMSTAELVTATSALVAFLNGPQTSSPPGQTLGLLGTVMSLGLLGFGCVWPAIMYMSHLRRPGRAPWPHTWQMQALATLAVVTLPLFSLALPLLLPSPSFIASSFLFLEQMAINLVEAGLLVAASFWSLMVAIS